LNKGKLKKHCAKLKINSSIFLGLSLSLLPLFVRQLDTVVEDVQFDPELVNIMMQHIDDFLKNIVIK
jgi:hypothetical protein